MPTVRLHSSLIVLLGLQQLIEVTSWKVLSKNLRDASSVEGKAVNGEKSHATTGLNPEHARAEAMFWARAATLTRRHRGKAKAAAAAARAEAEALAESEDPNSGGGASAGGPKTLKSYCEEGKDEDPTTHLRVGSEVKADWMGFGKLYEGTIKKENEDATYDIQFWDGWTEQGVPVSRIDLPEESPEEVEKKQKSKDNDAACELKDMINDVKDETEKAFMDVAAFVSVASGSMTGKGAEPEEIEEDFVNEEDEKVKTEQKQSPAPADKKGGAAPAPAAAEESVSADEQDSVSTDMKTTREESTGEAPKRESAGKAPGRESAGKAPERGSPDETSKAAAPAPAPAKADDVDAEKPAGMSEAGEEEEADEQLEDVAEDVRKLEDLATSADAGNIKMTEAEKFELEALKQKLKGVEAQEDKLEEQTSINNQKLQKLTGKNITDHPLLEEMRLQLALKKAHIRELQIEKARQQKELSTQRIKKGMFDHFQKRVGSLQAQLELLRRKREEFKRSNRLDSDLRMNIDRLLDQQESLMSKMKAMQAAGEKAEKALAAAGKKGAATMDESLSGVKVGAGAAGVTDNATKAAADAQKEMMAAAESFGDDLRKVSKDAHTLDTSIHPHGAKWWRYRYERAYVEALVMIGVAFLMMFYETMLRTLRLNVLLQAHSGGMLDIILHQGTMYMKWIEQLLITLAACLLVTLTIWFIDQVHGFDLLERCFKLDPTTKVEPVVHMPNTASEYKDVAMNVATILFFSVTLYSMASFAIVSHSMHILAVWAAESIGDQTHIRHSRFEISVTDSRSSFDHMQKYLLYHAEVDDVWNYLRLAVRDVVDYMLTFGFRAWASYFVSYMLIAALHRFMHCSYLWVICLWSMMAMAYFFIMVVVVTQARNNIVAHSTGEESIQSASMFGRVVHHTTHRVVPPPGPTLRFIRKSLGICLQYNLYFLCFSASRMMVQRHMWQLHFYVTLIILGLSVFAMTFYIFIVAPLIPAFAAAFALPPYIDESYIEHMANRIKGEAGTAAKDFMAWYNSSSRAPLLMPWQDIHDYANSDRTESGVKI